MCQLVLMHWQRACWLLQLACHCFLSLPNPALASFTAAAAHANAPGMDGYKMDGKSLIVRIAGQKDDRGPRSSTGSYRGGGHGDGGGEGDRMGALRGPHGTLHMGGAPQPPPPGGSSCVCDLHTSHVCTSYLCLGAFASCCADVCMLQSVLGSNAVCKVHCTAS